MTHTCLFLGTGASMGIPVIGCACPVCQSPNPKDKRFRCSALLKIEGRSILIDTSPDFRAQALQSGLTALDAVIWTHAHQDHTGGIDDLRPLFLKRKTALPCYLSKATYDELKVRFNYIIEPVAHSPSLQSKLEFHFVSTETEVDILGIPFTFFTYRQMGMEVIGIRTGTFAYVTDIKDFEPYLFEKLKGVETLVVSALRYEPSPIHFTLDDAVAFGKEIGARKTYLTHIAHEIGAEEGQRRLHEHAFLAFDGLEISI